MAVFTTLGTILSNHMYQYFKVSWSVIILNLQIVVAFAFDVIVMSEKFTAIELSGCFLMFVSNVLLVL